MSQARRSNIVLIGMPASGKSTVGVLLAKRLALAFVDTDLLIQTGEGRSLHQIIARDGIAAFRALEERYVCALDPTDTVVSTGGSVVYSGRAVEHLHKVGPLIFLDAPLADIELRIGDLDARGFVRRKGQSLGDVYAERRPLYLAAADRVIACAGLTQTAVVEAIVEDLET